MLVGTTIALIIPFKTHNNNNNKKINSSYSSSLAHDSKIEVGQVWEFSDRNHLYQEVVEKVDITNDEVWVWEMCYYEKSTFSGNPVGIIHVYEEPPSEEYLDTWTSISYLQTNSKFVGMYNKPEYHWKMPAYVIDSNDICISTNWPPTNHPEVPPGGIVVGSGWKIENYSEQKIKSGKSRDYSIIFK